MVKIRLRRLGNKHRPFYRVVVAKSTAGRDGAFVEVLGSYNPVAKNRDERVKLNNERALHWLMMGAQPTDTVAHMLKQAGVLEEFFKARPNAVKKYKGLDKRVAAITTQSAVTTTAPAPVAEVATPAQAVEAATPEAEVAAPAVEEAPAAEVVAEATPEA